MACRCWTSPITRRLFTRRRAPRTGYPGRRVWAVFEPHVRQGRRCSRPIARAFSAADEVVARPSSARVFLKQSGSRPNSSSRISLREGRHARHIPEMGRYRLDDRPRAPVMAMSWS